MASLNFGFLFKFIIVFFEFCILVFLKYTIDNNPFRKIQPDRLLAIVSAKYKLRDKRLNQTLYAVQIDPFASEPYINDKYLAITYDSIDKTKYKIKDYNNHHPKTYTFNYMTNAFEFRNSLSSLKVNAKSDTVVEYDSIGDSSLDNMPDYYFKKRIKANNDTEFFISTKYICLGKVHMNLPLNRGTYYKELKISNSFYANSPLLSGYIHCVDDISYSVQTCPYNNYFSIPQKKCVPFKEQSDLHFISDEEVLKFMSK